MSKYLIFIVSCISVILILSLSAKSISGELKLLENRTADSREKLSRYEGFDSDSSFTNCSKENADGVAILCDFNSVLSDLNGIGVQVTKYKNTENFLSATFVSNPKDFLKFINYENSHPNISFSKLKFSSSDGKLVGTFEIAPNVSSKKIAANGDFCIMKFPSPEKRSQKLIAGSKIESHKNETLSEVLEKHPPIEETKFLGFVSDFVYFKTKSGAVHKIISSSIVEENSNFIIASFNDDKIKIIKHDL